MAKPPFPWIGSKEKIAPYILQLFPPKLTQYVEPFGGSGAVLLALPPDPNRLDIYNDLDAELVNLYSCIKECSNVLLRELKFLPIHSRKLFEYYRDFVAHKEVYFQNVQAEIECLGDRSCFTEEQAGELLPIFQERLALFDVKRAAAYYLAIRGSFSATVTSFSGCFHASIIAVQSFKSGSGHGRFKHSQATCARCSSSITRGTS